MNNPRDYTFILSSWFDHISQQNRLLSHSIDNTNSQLRLIERNLHDQRLHTLRLMERIIPQQNNIFTPPTLLFNNNNRNNNNIRSTNNNNNTNEAQRNNIFRSQPIWRFGDAPPPPPPPHPRWTANRRNRRVSNLIHESINRWTLPRNNIPTSLQIHDTTSTSKWKDIKNTTDQRLCPITQQDFYDNDDILKINQCGHIFKKDSLVTWFERSSLCPVCRHNILDPSNNTQTNLNSLNRIISSLNNDISNNFILDVSLDIIGESILTSPMVRNTANSSTNTDTDISSNNNHK
jgi:hypothetical protein